MKLTHNQQKILNLLTANKGIFVSPTDIGREAGGMNSRGFWRHSSWASPICKRLVERELIERNKEGHYRVL